MVPIFMSEAVNPVNIFITYNGSNFDVRVIYLFQITNESSLMVPTLKLETFTNKYFQEMVLRF